MIKPWKPHYFPGVHAWWLLFELFCEQFIMQSKLNIKHIYSHSHSLRIKYIFCTLFYFFNIHKMLAGNKLVQECLLWYSSSEVDLPQNNSKLHSFISNTEGWLALTYEPLCLLGFGRLPFIFFSHSFINQVVIMLLHSFSRKYSLIQVYAFMLNLVFCKGHFKCLRLKHWFSFLLY